MPDALVRVRGLTRRFGSQVALRGVDLDLAAGETHGLLGGNGAGKSTLIKILSGVLPADRGEILVDGRTTSLRSPARARAAGIATIHQEIDLAPNLSLAENLLLGAQPRGLLGISWRRLREQARAALAVLGVDLDVGVPAGASSAAVRQLVCIARALRQRARLLILDEPTSSLDQREVERVFAAVRTAVRSGVGALFVTHFLDQAYALCDRITVLRDGQRVATTPIADLPRATLIEQMLGKLPDQAAPMRETAASIEPPVLEARGVVRDDAPPFDLTIRPGEIVGVAGLLGSGRSELVRTLFGLPAPRAGQLHCAGVPARIRSPRDAVRLGFALCPEDRRAEGVFANLSVRENLCVLARLRGRFWVARAQESALVERLVAELGIKLRHADDAVRKLSGGNQQKVVLGRWFSIAPRLLILDEPTRGIDLGAKADIERLIAGARARGAAILVVSSELAEVVRIADRVLVLSARRVVAELPRGQASEASIAAAIAAAGA